MPERSAADAARLAALRKAEDRALALLDRIARDGLIAPGRGEREIEDEIGRIARADYGVERDWHERLVRVGANTLAVAGEDAPPATISDDDMVFVDLGPVFATWEADVGRSFVVGEDPAKHALCAALPDQFARVRDHYLGRPGITGAELYAFAVASAERAGWRFGGRIAGHIVGEYNHRDWPGDRQSTRIGPGNPGRLADPDPFGRERFWILEIHLVSPDGRFGGFYERLIH